MRLGKRAQNIGIVVFALTMVAAVFWAYVEVDSGGSLDRPGVTLDSNGSPVLLMGNCRTSAIIAVGSGFYGDSFPPIASGRYLWSTTMIAGSQPRYEALIGAQNAGFESRGILPTDGRLMKLRVDSSDGSSEGIWWAQRDLRVDQVVLGDRTVERAKYDQSRAGRGC